MKHDKLNHIMLDVTHIHQHPDNPRKDLGDLDELAESIRKNGIMQNLTVIPMDEMNEDCEEYTVIIGHRRLAAAKQAGAMWVPCNIVYGLSHKEQVGIMLEENMQRSDLTPIEQAYGFQMMLDLGETEESIAEKTGFSRSTIHHRLEIAKLDKRIVKETEEFQFTIADYMALEQIKSVARRNAILNTATSSAELRSKAAYEAKSEMRAETKEALVKKLEEIGITEMPEKLAYKIYEGGFTEIKTFALDEKLPEEIDVEAGTKEEPVYWYARWDSIQILRKRKRVKAERNVEAEKKEADRKHLADIMEKLTDERRTHIKAMLDGTAKRIEQAAENWDVLFNQMYGEDSQYTRFENGAIRELITGKQDWKLQKEEREAADQEIEKLRPIDKMLVMAERGMEYRRPFPSYGRLEYKEAPKLTEWHEFLKMYGFTITDMETRKVLDGTHELYEVANEGQDREADQQI